MKVILLKDIAGIGRKGDVKDVAEGYAQNFLLPRKMGVVATEKEVARLKIERSRDEEERKIQEELLEKNIESLSEKKIVIKSKASEAGHLFAGIHKTEVLKAIEEQTNIKLPEESLLMKGMLKEIGEHRIEIKTEGKKAELVLSVEAL
ncbi:MAG TPA: 50S ribosomal protein L9 [Candidatus Paceibacterota bacterium]